MPTVLMDENLLASMLSLFCHSVGFNGIMAAVFQQPLCVSERSKSNLAHTIRNDSAFLSSVNVMGAHLCSPVRMHA